jgi:hypothetical protein
MLSTGDVVLYFLDVFFVFVTLKFMPDVIEEFFLGHTVQG